MFKSGKETKALLLLGCYKIGFALLCVGLLFASADQGWFCLLYTSDAADE